MFELALNFQRQITWFSFILINFKYFTLHLFGNKSVVKCKAIVDVFVLIGKCFVLIAKCFVYCFK